MNDAAQSPIYIANAGLVLVHPFLPHLFSRLGLFSTGEAGSRRQLGEHGARAVQLLQYLADGRTDAPESELALNKLLCGLSPDFPASPIELSYEEMAVCDQLLLGVIDNWTAVRNTSRENLRESFLQRNGYLRWQDGRCTLTVSRKPLDVLLDRIEWSLSIIAHAWMPQALSVTW